MIVRYGLNIFLHEAWSIHKFHYLCCDHISEVANIHESLFMDLVVINDSEPRRLAFYLAEEEYLARKYPDRDFFFAWQVKPTVIIGRNQQMAKEVNVDFCRNAGVEIVRRKSGGGAVVADMNNIMFSYITSSDDVCGTFGKYTSMVVASLRMLGLDASDNSRNEILIGDQKVSGNSYYHIPGRSIVHGTMLYDYDPVLMGNALTPSHKKMSSHGVKSTRSRVTTIKEKLPELSISNFLDHVLHTVPMGGNVLTLTADDLKEIEKIEQEYYAESWLRGKNPKGSLQISERIDGVGEICIDLSVSHGLISDFEMTGDYLENTDASTVLKNLLVGCPFDREAVLKLLDTIEIRDIIPALTSRQIVNLIF